MPSRLGAPERRTLLPLQRRSQGRGNANTAPASATARPMSTTRVSGSLVFANHDKAGDHRENADNGDNRIPPGGRAHRDAVRHCQWCGEGNLAPEDQWIEAAQIINAPPSGGPTLLMADEIFCSEASAPIHPAEVARQGAGSYAVPARAGRAEERAAMCQYLSQGVVHAGTHHGGHTVRLSQCLCGRAADYVPAHESSLPQPSRRRRQTRDRVPPPSNSYPHPSHTYTFAAWRAATLARICHLACRSMRLDRHQVTRENG